MRVPQTQHSQELFQFPVTGTGAKSKTTSSCSHLGTQPRDAALYGGLLVTAGACDESVLPGMKEDRQQQRGALSTFPPPPPLPHALEPRQPWLEARADKQLSDLGAVLDGARLVQRLAGASAGAPCFPVGAMLKLRLLLLVPAEVCCPTVPVGPTRGHRLKAWCWTCLFTACSGGGRCFGTQTCGGAAGLRCGVWVQATA